MEGMLSMYQFVNLHLILCCWAVLKHCNYWTVSCEWHCCCVFCGTWNKRPFNCELPRCGTIANSFLVSQQILEFMTYTCLKNMFSIFYMISGTRQNTGIDTYLFWNTFDSQLYLLSKFSFLHQPPKTFHNRYEPKMSYVLPRRNV